MIVTDAGISHCSLLLLGPPAAGKSALIRAFVSATPVHPSVYIPSTHESVVVPHSHSHAHSLARSLSLSRSASRAEAGGSSTMSTLNSRSTLNSGSLLPSGPSSILSSSLASESASVSMSPSGSKSASAPNPTPSPSTPALAISPFDALKSDSDPRSPSKRNSDSEISPAPASLVTLREVGGDCSLGPILPHAIASADAFIIVYDSTSRKSFESVFYYFSLIATTKQRIPPIAVVGSKIDLPGRQVSHELRDSLRSTLNVPFYETTSRAPAAIRLIIDDLLLSLAKLDWRALNVLQSPVITRSPSLLSLRPSLVNFSGTHAQDQTSKFSAILRLRDIAWLGYSQFQDSRDLQILKVIEKPPQTTVMSCRSNSVGSAKSGHSLTTDRRRTSTESLLKAGTVTMRELKTLGEQALSAVEALEAKEQAWEVKDASPTSKLELIRLDSALCLAPRVLDSIPELDSFKDDDGISETADFVEAYFETDFANVEFGEPETVEEAQLDNSCLSDKKPAATKKKESTKDKIVNMIRSRSRMSSLTSNGDQHSNSAALDNDNEYHDGSSEGEEIDLSTFLSTSSPSISPTPTPAPPSIAGDHRPSSTSPSSSVKSKKSLLKKISKMNMRRTFGFSLSRESALGQDSAGSQPHTSSTPSIQRPLEPMSVTAPSVANIDESESRHQSSMMDENVSEAIMDLLQGYIESPYATTTTLTISKPTLTIVTKSRIQKPLPPLPRLLPTDSKRSAISKAIESVYDASRIDVLKSLLDELSDLELDDIWE